jgi:3-hydroxybutyryl-CoA dehydrogenase
MDRKPGMAGLSVAEALTPSRAVAIVGSGTMGAGIGQVAAIAGHTVRFYDVETDAIGRAIASVRQRIWRLAETGRIRQEAAEKAAARIQPATELENLADAGMVIEAIVENAEVKRRLFRTLEDIVQPDCILATNTSSISINLLASALRNPGRLIGMHFFNPAPTMRLVEVIHGLATEEPVAAVVFETAKAWGKVPVYAKSTPGFIVNRIARPYYAEALRLLSEQAAEPITVDAILRDCGGFRMGPFELMDLIGLDVNFAVTQSVFQAYFCDPRFRPSTIQQELVNAGYLGRKSGRGFFSYGDEKPLSPPYLERQKISPLGASIIEDSAFGKALIDRLRKTVDVSRLAPHSDERVIEVGNAVVYQTDGRTGTERAYMNGIRDTVVFDLALDYSTSPRMALAPADTCSPESFMAVVALLQLAGYAVSRIDDVAGMVVMRTVAMLANEASDVVNQGICTAEAADTAMQLGMNYPIGPLAWAELVGADRFHVVLTHLANHYGEDRYRISPGLRRKYWRNASDRQSRA